MFVSLILGFIDAIVLLAMDQEEFDRRYNDHKSPGQYDRYRRQDTRRDYQRTSGSRPPVYQPGTRKPPAHAQVPERHKANPYKQSGIKKYKDYELEDAIADFEKGLQINPKDIALHFNIACAYSLTEKVEKAYHHIDKAVEFGFTDFERIKTHDDLAYVRIQPQFDDFAAAGYRLKKEEPVPQTPEADQTPDINEVTEDKLLAQLKRLAELRDKGLITENEFSSEKQKLMR
jgi:tetratricopeptide (TPR) repeat protein